MLYESVSQVLSFLPPLLDLICLNQQAHQKSIFMADQEQ